jgi:hypothetical protein
VTGVKPGATVLAVHPTEQAGGEPLPVVAVQRFGGGRVLALTGDTTWKWKFQIEGRGLDSPYYRFWRQSVRWLSGRRAEEFRDGSLLSAWPAEVEYEREDTVRLHAQVRRRDREPHDSATVKAELHYPAPVRRQNSRGEEFTEDSTTVELRHVPLSLGQYQASWQSPTAGIFRAVVTASDEEGPLGQTEFEFVVGEATTEFDRVDVDELALRSISSETGGEFHTLADAGRIPDELENRRRSIISHKDINPWNTPWAFYLLFLGFVASEWILRKKSGLS